CQRGDKGRHVQVLYAGAHQKPQPHAHKQREGNADDRVQAGQAHCPLDVSQIDFSIKQV
ncbi:MAG: hypothetical protein GX781_06895, partial [Clostridiales bacterium]|nr:hypothetical protein [Clostridiales bacterium]